MVGRRRVEIVVDAGEQKGSQKWEWNQKEAKHYQYHQDRFPLIRPVSYEATARLTQEGEAALLPGNTGTALSINVSNGGLCLLMETEPMVREVLRIQIPMPVIPTSTPTLAEVRWVRQAPFAQKGVYLVGLRFLL